MIPLYFISPRLPFKKPSQFVYLINSMQKSNLSQSSYPFPCYQPSMPYYPVEFSFPPEMQHHYAEFQNRHISDNGFIPANFQYHPYAQVQYPEQPMPQYSYKPTIIQRISSIISFQLPELRQIVAQSKNIPQINHEDSSEKVSSVSNDKIGSIPETSSSIKLQKWSCKKCDFSNYRWRKKCKNCSNVKGFKNFIPGPQDWKCQKCQNINYARRKMCNLCKALKN